MKYLPLLTLLSFCGTRKPEIMPAYKTTVEYQVDSVLKATAEEMQPVDSTLYYLKMINGKLDQYHDTRR